MALSMEFLNLLSSFFVIILTYPFVRLRLCHETKSKKSSNQFFWPETNPFWWVIFAPKILPKSRPPFAPVSIYPPPSTQQPIHGSRGDVGINLSHHSGVRADRDLLPPKTKWRLPIPHRITHLPQSDNPKAFPISNGTFSSSQIEDTTRSLSLFNDRKTQISNQGDLRSRLYGPSPLWQTGDGSDRIQSEEVGQALLSPPSLLQWDHQRFLAWGTPPWRCPYRYWDRRTPEGSLWQIAFFCKGRNYPSRQGFLRSRDHRISRIQESPFCHCCQAYRSGQERNLDLILSGSFIWSGDCGVHVSTHQVEKRMSLCGGKASHPRRPYGTTHPLFNGQVQLSSYCDEYEVHPTEYLEVLQWPSRRRTYYQRTQRGLSLGENPHEILRSQRGILSYPSVLLQSHQLVQATVFTHGVSKYDA